jgi:hypothetical protein
MKVKKKEMMGKKRDNGDLVGPIERTKPIYSSPVTRLHAKLSPGDVGVSVSTQISPTSSRLRDIE